MDLFYGDIIMDENINSVITNNENTNAANNDAEKMVSENGGTETAVDTSATAISATDKKPAKKESGGVFLAILYLIGNFFLFNIVFILLMLPVFTIGTALTAYFDIVFTAKYDKKHRDYSVKMLLQRFREHLKLTMSYFVGYLLVMGFFVAIALLFSPIGPIPNNLLSVLFIIFAGILFAILIYTFPVLAINAVTSDYRATVYAIQDRDRAEKRAAEKAAARAEEETAEKGVVGAEDSEKETLSEASDNSVNDSHTHETEVLTAYMKRFSKVSRAPIESREIMKKGSYNVSNSAVDSSDSSKDSPDESKSSDNIAEEIITKGSEEKSLSDGLKKNSETRAVAVTEPIYTYSTTPIPEDRNSLGNVLLDSIYFAAKHFVGLMFTLILYLLPGLIVYIFYEDTVLLIAGFVIIGFRMIMGINARIYYGSFFEYDDELDEDTYESGSENETGSEEESGRADDTQEENVYVDEEIEVSFEAVSEIDEIGQTEEIPAEIDEAEDRSSTVAERIKNILNIRENGSEDDDADEDMDFDADEEAEENGDSDSMNDDDDIEITF